MEALDAGGQVGGHVGTADACLDGGAPGVEPPEQVRTQLLAARDGGRVAALARLGQAELPREVQQLRRLCAASGPGETDREVQPVALGQRLLVGRRVAQVQPALLAAVRQRAGERGDDDRSAGVVEDGERAAFEPPAAGRIGRGHLLAPAVDRPRLAGPVHHREPRGGKLDGGLERRVRLVPADAERLRQPVARVRPRPAAQHARGHQPVPAPPRVAAPVLRLLVRVAQPRGLRALLGGVVAQPVVGLADSDLRGNHVRSRIGEEALDLARRVDVEVQRRGRKAHRAPVDRQRGRVDRQAHGRTHRQVEPPLRRRDAHVAAEGHLRPNLPPVLRAEPAVAQEVAPVATEELLHDEVPVPELHADRLAPANVLDHRVEPQLLHVGQHDLGLELLRAAGQPAAEDAPVAVVDGDALEPRVGGDAEVDAPLPQVRPPELAPRADQSVRALPGEDLRPVGDVLRDHSAERPRPVVPLLAQVAHAAVRHDPPAVFRALGDQFRARHDLEGQRRLAAADAHQVAVLLERAVDLPAVDERDDRQRVVELVVGEVQLVLVVAPVAADDLLLHVLVDVVEQRPRAVALDGCEPAVLQQHGRLGELHLVGERVEVVALCVLVGQARHGGEGLVRRGVAGGEELVPPRLVHLERVFEKDDELQARLLRGRDVLRDRARAGRQRRAGPDEPGRLRLVGGRALPGPISGPQRLPDLHGRVEQRLGRGRPADAGLGGRLGEPAEDVREDAQVVAGLSARPGGEHRLGRRAVARRGEQPVVANAQHGEAPLARLADGQQRGRLVEAGLGHPRLEEVVVPLRRARAHGPGPANDDGPLARQVEAHGRLAPARAVPHQRQHAANALVEGRGDAVGPGEAAPHDVGGDVVGVAVGEHLPPRAGAQRGQPLVGGRPLLRLAPGVRVADEHPAAIGEELLCGLAIGLAQRAGHHDVVLAAGQALAQLAGLAGAQIDAHLVQRPGGVPRVEAADEQHGRSGLLCPHPAGAAGQAQRDTHSGPAPSSRSRHAGSPVHGIFV